MLQPPLNGNSILAAIINVDIIEQWDPFESTVQVRVIAVLRLLRKLIAAIGLELFGSLWS